MLKQDTQSDLKLGERKDGEGMPKIYAFSDTSVWRDFQVNEASSISVFVSEFDAIKLLQKSVFVEQEIGCCDKCPNHSLNLFHIIFYAAS